MISWLRVKLNSWKEHRFLKRHGCSTWKQYHRWYDPDCNMYATKIKDFYKGYLYIHVIDDRSHYCYTVIGEYGPGGTLYGYDTILKWCEENLSHKIRADYIRGYKDDVDGEWNISELGGTDRIFFAFADSKDYTKFLLRWS